MTTEPKDAAGTAAPASEFHPDTYPLRVQLLAAWRAWFDWRREKPRACTWDNPRRAELGLAVGRAAVAYEAALRKHGLTLRAAAHVVLDVEELAMREHESAKAQRATVQEAAL